MYWYIIYNVWNIPISLYYDICNAHWWHKNELLFMGHWVPTCQNEYGAHKVVFVFYSSWSKRPITVLASQCTLPTLNVNSLFPINISLQTLMLWIALGSDSYKKNTRYAFSYFILSPSIHSSRMSVLYSAHSKPTCQCGCYVQKVSDVASQW